MRAGGKIKGGSGRGPRPELRSSEERIKSLKQELDVHLRKMEDFKVSINQISSSHSSLPQIIMND